MLYVILAILAVIAALLLIAVVRALIIKAPAPGVCETRITQPELDAAAKKLGAMVESTTPLGGVFLIKHNRFIKNQY